MALEAVYRYVVFLPSKQHAEVPVPNRFFCVPEDGGEIKIRGLECRRHDTPPIVARMQREVLAIVAEAHDYESYCRKLEEAREVLDRYLARVEDGSAPIEELIISRRMARPPGAYKQANATAIAARQLDRSGVELRPGETIEYVITDADSNYSDDRFRAYTMWEGWRGYDVKEYQRALREAFKPLEVFATGQGKRSRRISQFSQNCLDRPFEDGKRILYNPPNLLQINTEIVVDHNVPECGNSTSVQLQVERPKMLR